MRFRFRTVVALAVATLVWAVASVALAEASVVVKVRTPQGEPANGKVTLEQKGGDGSFSCTTSAGSCRIEDVPGGRYKVELEPDEGEPPEPKTVMIPPSGEVSLIVSTK